MSRLGSTQLFCRPRRCASRPGSRWSSPSRWRCCSISSSKSLDDLEATSEVVLRQLSSDTAESLTRAVEDYLKRPHISVLLRIPQARTEPLDLAWIDPIFRDALKESPFVESFYVWTERGPRANEWITFDHGQRRCSPSARFARALPRGSGVGADAAAAPARADEDAHVDRRVHRRSARPQALRAGTAAVGGPGARSHDQRASPLPSTPNSCAPSSSRPCCATG